MVKKKKNDDKRNSDDVSYVTFVEKKATIRTDSNQSNIESNGTLIVGMGTKMDSNQSNIESNGTLIKDLDSNRTVRVEEEKQDAERTDVRSPPPHGNRTTIVVEKGGKDGFFSNLFCCF